MSDAAVAWQQAPGNRWAFWHVDEFLPTRRVGASVLPRPLATRTDAPDVAAVEVHRVDGRRGTLADVLADSYTDACLILHDGEIVFERYAELGAPHLRHALMSVTKPVVGCVAGILAEAGQLDPNRAVTEYVPELEASGYRGATVRDVLDMRSGVHFREEYSNEYSEIRELDRWIHRSQRSDADDRQGLYRFLRTLRQERPHAGLFQYRSAETDVLGWVCERASGRQMADLMTTLVWQPMGAESDAPVICDGSGTVIHDGGLCSTLRDVARFGQMLADGGVVPNPDGSQRTVVPARWLRQGWAVDAATRAAFAGSPAEVMFRGGWFRNQLWFRPGPFGDVLVCLGIHGQMVHVSRRTRTVCVKLSSWPDAQRPAYLQDTVRAFDAVGGALSGTLPRDPRGRLPGVVAGVHRKGGTSRQHDSMI
ncbi:MAG: serine hydrolase domain-containing protein [Actinomycetes bacterium]